MSKESFKNFARSHPELADFVMRGEGTWQKLYELYDIYGENSNIWKKYISSDTEYATKDISLREVFNNIKNIDMDSFQKGIENLQKTVGLLQNIGLGQGGVNLANKPYQPRMLYHHLED